MHSEDNQDLAPDTEMQNVSEIQSEVSTDDIKFQNLAEEVLNLLQADMFPKKTEEFSGGNRPRSSIELEMQKVTKKSISLPHSRRPLIKAVDCLKESLGASKVDDSIPMPPTITQDWVPSKADIKKLVQLKYYQAHNEFIPTATASLDPDANCMGMSITDAMSIATAQTLGLQQLSREAAIESVQRGSLTDEAKRKLRLSSFTSKLLFDGQIGSIYKENMSENQEILIRNAVSYQAKPNPSSSSSRRRKPRATGKNKTKPQETPKKDFFFPTPRPPKKRTILPGI